MEYFMPEISRFLGIIIKMHWNEHNPPHFHAEYNQYKAVIDINTLTVTTGKLPGKVLGLVIEWAEIHQVELLENWNCMRSTPNYKKITPLI